MTRAALVAETQRLVRDAIAATDPKNKSARGFAKRIQVNERSVRRWQEGTSTIRDASLRARLARMAETGVIATPE